MQATHHPDQDFAHSCWSQKLTRFSIKNSKQHHTKTTITLKRLINAQGMVVFSIMQMS
ncbi:Putative protein without homology [Lacticaseibacillus rhamnosus GG]|nr:Putative protein without homology [Lacticaseibacillus rhamnosus GG]